MDRVGAAYPFIVGRSNSKVTFDDQSAVYNAVATSLTAWITDERVQDDMIAYSSGNWQARVGANVLPDESGLISPVHRSPAFSSMGFGRVTLGREKFLEYSAERFARSVVDRMLYAHVEDDQLFARMTEREWVRVAGRRRLPAIHQRSAPERGDRGPRSGHRRAASERASRADPGRAQPRRRPASQRPDPARQVGRTRPHHVVGPAPERVLRALGRAPAARPARSRRCCSTSGSPRCRPTSCTPSRATSPRSGLPRRDRDARPPRPHDEERRRRPRDRGAGARRVGQRPPVRSSARNCRQAPNQQSIRPDQDVVAHAIERLAQALGWASEARVRESASSLLGELRDNFLAPLRAHLDGALERAAPAGEHPQDERQPRQRVRVLADAQRPHRAAQVRARAERATARRAHRLPGGVRASRAARPSRATASTRTPSSTCSSTCSSASLRARWLEGGCRDLGADRQPAQLEAVGVGRPVREVQHPDPALPDGDRSRGLPRAGAGLDAPRGHAVPRLHHRGPAQLLRRERADARRVREAPRSLPRAAAVRARRQRAARQAQPVAAAVGARQGDQRGHEPRVQLDPVPRGHRDARHHQGRARTDGLLGRRDLRRRGSRTRGSTASRSSRCRASPISRS